MGWLEIIIYALISGIAEFLPVSSVAHQSILLKLFGCTENMAALNFTVHFGALAALYINCQSHLAAFGRTQRILSIPKRRRKRQPDWELVSELRLFKTASVFSVIAALASVFTYSFNRQLLFVALFLILNGIVLYCSGRVATGNKSAGNMIGFDGLFIGFSSALGVVPGFSRLGCGITAAVVRGAAPSHALRWSLLISVPTLCALCVADVILIFTQGVVGFGFMTFLQCIVGAVVSFCGTWISILLLRFFSVKIGFSSFSLYSWGAGLFAFLLYMI